MLSSDGETEYSPRIYLLNEAEDAYEMLQLTGQEFAFDVDMSKLPCGMNSALYLSESKQLLDTILTPSRRNAFPLWPFIPPICMKPLPWCSDN
jgi:hypothetical protein